MAYSLDAAYWYYKNKDKVKSYFGSLEMIDDMNKCIDDYYGNVELAYKVYKRREELCISMEELSRHHDMNSAYLKGYYDGKDKINHWLFMSKMLSKIGFDNNFEPLEKNLYEKMVRILEGQRYKLITGSKMDGSRTGTVTTNGSTILSFINEYQEELRAIKI